MTRKGSTARLPTGTVTLLFSDVEGSTAALKRLGERYAGALEVHGGVVTDAVATAGGTLVDTQGDSLFAVFTRARDAVAAAVALQRGLAAADWPDGVPLAVRVGVHTGEPEVSGGRYVGLVVHRAARICAAGHGRQILLSRSTREVLRDDPFPEARVRDLGEHRLKDIDGPERLYQLLAPGLVE